jgi:glycine oxidase
MSLKTPDVVVAGAGIVGLSAACELSRRGLRCLVLDRGRVGREASHAAGGILSPQGEARPGSPLLPLALLGRDRHVRLADELLDLTGISVEHQKQGVLSIAFSAEEESALRELTSAQRGLGLRAEMMSREEVRRIEPSVHDETCAAALYPDDHRVNNRRLLDALRTLALARGVELREFTAVRSVETTEGRLVAVRTDGGRIETRSLVNALGAWAGQIDGLADALPVRPVKGHMMALVDGPAVQHVLYGRHGYIVPRNDGRLIVGSTMEEAGFDARITVEGISRVSSRSPARSPPQPEPPSVAETWIGLPSRDAPTAFP